MTSVIQMTISHHFLNASKPITSTFPTVHTHLSVFQKTKKEMYVPFYANHTFCQAAKRRTER